MTVLANIRCLYVVSTVVSCCKYYKYYLWYLQLHVVRCRDQLESRQHHDEAGPVLADSEVLNFKSRLTVATQRQAGAQSRKEAACGLNVEPQAEAILYPPEPRARGIPRRLSLGISGGWASIYPN